MNFCFVLDDLLAASSQPGKNRRIQAYLDLYKENNIKVLLSLYKKIHLPEDYKDDFITYYYKINDSEIPALEELDKIVDTVMMHITRKEAVNVNCAAGISKSGLVLIAVLMKYHDIDYQEAFGIVSEHRYAIEEEETKLLLTDYQKFLQSQKVS